MKSIVKDFVCTLVSFCLIVCPVTLIAGDEYLAIAEVEIAGELFVFRVVDATTINIEGSDSIIDLEYDLDNRLLTITTENEEGVTVIMKELLTDVPSYSQAMELYDVLSESGVKINGEDVSVDQILDSYQLNYPHASSIHRDGLNNAVNKFVGSKAGPAIGGIITELFGIGDANAAALTGSEPCLDYCEIEFNGYLLSASAVVLNCGLAVFSWISAFSCAIALGVHQNSAAIFADCVTAHCQL